MLFILEDHLKYKNNQTFNLSLAEQTLKNKEKSKQTLASFLSKQKLIKVDKNIKTHQSDVEELKKIIKIHFWNCHKIMFCLISVSTHNDMSVILVLAALIPPSTAKVEHSFSLMKLICTRLRKSMSSKTLCNCMWICKFREMTNKDYNSILQRCLKADDNKSKKKESCISFIVVRKSRWNFNTINKTKLFFLSFFVDNLCLYSLAFYLVIIIIIDEK